MCFILAQDWILDLGLYHSKKLSDYSLLCAFLFVILQTERMTILINNIVNFYDKYKLLVVGYKLIYLV